LYQQYKENKGKPIIQRQQNQVRMVELPNNQNRDKSLFVPPMAGQSGADYHPQLKSLTSDNTSIVYYSWHVHVYFFHEDVNVTQRTLALRDQFIKQFSLATCDDSCFMGGPFDTCTQGMCVWDPYYGVDGPHPYGQWGVYMPNEYLAETVSWFSMNHGEFDTLFHPNTGYMVGDHDQSKRAIWIKQMVPLDLDFLVWLQCQWFECSDEVTLAAVKQ
jgi:aromatic ring-cleaving dioxygenase